MRNRFFFGIDVCLAIAVVFVSFTARFEGLSWWPSMWRMALWYIAIAVPVKVVLFRQVGLYRRLWRYASIADLETLVLACLLGTVASFAVGVVLLPGVGLTETRIPIGILVMDCALTAASIALPRLSLRILARHYRHFISNGWCQNSGGSDEIRRVLIAGAGDAGGKVAKELLENPQLGLAPVGFIDDDATKHRHQLHGIPVLGPLSRLGEFVGALSVSEV